MKINFFNNSNPNFSNEQKKNKIKKSGKKLEKFRVAFMLRLTRNIILSTF